MPCRAPQVIGVVGKIRQDIWATVLTEPPRLMT